MPRHPFANTHLGPLTTVGSTALGAHVIATAGSPAKLEICKQKGGADHVLDYTQKDWQKKVMELTNGKGVDVSPLPPFFPFPFPLPSPS